jgi:hypothetical protein
LIADEECQFPDEFRGPVLDHNANLPSFTNTLLVAIQTTIYDAIGYFRPMKVEKFDEE